MNKIINCYWRSLLFKESLPLVIIAYGILLVFVGYCFLVPYLFETIKTY